MRSAERQKLIGGFDQYVKDQQAKQKMKAPTVRRRFGSVLDELAYLDGRLMFWMYVRMAPSRARPVAERMARLLRRIPA
jgi:hypothetical protein